MQPVQELLNRIRWDVSFGDAEFSVAYYDRVTNRLVTVPFRELCFDSDDHFSFGITDEIGAIHWVPYHRVRALYRNGDLVWQRVGSELAESLAVEKAWQRKSDEAG